MQRYFRLTIILALLSLTLFQACSDEPDQLLDEETYSNVLAELTIVNQIEETYLGDRTKEQLRKEVFEKYQVTREQFRISHDYYQRDMESQIQRVEEIRQRLRADRDSIQEAEREFRLELETQRVRDSLSRANEDSIRAAEPDSLK